MSTKRITIYEEVIEEFVIEGGEQKQISIHNDSPSVIKLFESGPPGPKGDTGESGLGEPFYLISTDLYGTTSSLAFQGQISSSIIPFLNGEFNLGSSSKSWNNLFLSNSIYFINSNSELNRNFLRISHSLITTESFGFDNFFIKRIANNQQIFLIQSASVSASFTQGGIFHVSEFSYLPPVISGGIIKSGSDYFFGV